MEKTFRLVKLYPGSPQLGTIATVESFGGFILNQPEFWQEIPEFPVGTKIVDTQSIYLLSHSRGNIFEKTENGWKPYNFPLENLKGDFPESEIGEGKRFQIISDKISLEWKINSIIGNLVPVNILFEGDVTPDFYPWLKYPDWKIHSILRMEDDLIFTIGDLVKTQGGNSFRISEFKIREKDNKILVSSLEYTFICTLDELIQLKRVIFTTDDQVGILGGDRYFFVRKDLSSTAIGEFKKASHISSSRSNDFLYFSNYENALDYLVNNLKVFSIEEVKDILSFPESEVIKMLKEILLLKIKRNEIIN
jgi:hypothetical protein